SVALPLLAPDVPVVTWWHCTPPERIAYDPLGVVADRRVTDCANTDDPAAALRQRAVDYAPGDTDLAWTRITSWRTLIAGAFDAAPAQVAAIRIDAPMGDPGTMLLAGWLSARLGIVPEITGEQRRLTEVTITFADGSETSIVRANGTA